MKIDMPHSQDLSCPQVPLFGLLCQRRQYQVLEPDRTVVALQLEGTRLAFIRCARNLQAGEKGKRDSNSAKSDASQDFHFGLLASDDYTSNLLYQSENAIRGAGPGDSFR
jgi:hypothetical protein